MNKYYWFNDIELYMLKRVFIESSHNIFMVKDYSEKEKKVHTKMINEVIDELKRREEGQ